MCFLRPTRENVARIRRELRDPRYGEYNLCGATHAFERIFLQVQIADLNLCACL